MTAQVEISEATEETAILAFEKARYEGWTQNECILAALEAVAPMLVRHGMEKAAEIVDAYAEEFDDNGTQREQAADAIAAAIRTAASEV